MNKIEKYLSKNALNYEIRSYSIGCSNAKEAALEIGLSYNQMYKSLLCQTEGHYTVVVIPSKSTLNNRYKLVQPGLVENITGYTIGTVSPILLKAGVKVIIDKSVNKFKKIGIGCGEYGKELIISTKDLISLTKGLVIECIALNKSSVKIVV